MVPFPSRSGSDYHPPNTVPKRVRPSGVPVKTITVWGSFTGFGSITPDPDESRRNPEPLGPALPPPVDVENIPGTLHSSILVLRRVRPKSGTGTLSSCGCLWFSPRMSRTSDGSQAYRCPLRTSNNIKSRDLVFRLVSNPVSELPRTVPGTLYL